MKKKLFLGIGLIAFIMLLAGATMLYNRLSENASPGNLMTTPSAETATEAETDTDASSEAETETDTDTSSEAETEIDTDVSSEAETETEAEPDIYPAPDFTVYDLNGNAFSLADFKGTPVILNFWASWCPPCKSEMPDFEEAYKTYGDQIQFMMINLTDGSQETVESASEYVAGQGYTFPVFYDTDVSAAMAYSTSSIPASYFVNADGNLAAYAVGMIDAATLEKGVQLLLQ